MKQLFYIFTPFLLLVLCLGVINIVPRWLALPAERPTQPAEAAVREINPTAVPPTATTLPTVTPLPTPTPTSTPRPTLPPDAAIILLGPPDNGVFPATAVLSFYWSWPAPLVEAQQQFVLYGRSGDAETPLGVLTEANLGDGYRLHLPAEQLGEPGTAVQWQVRLETPQQTILMTSPWRTLTLLP